MGSIGDPSDIAEGRSRAYRLTVHEEGLETAVIIPPAHQYSGKRSMEDVCQITGNPAMIGKRPVKTVA